MLWSLASATAMAGEAENDWRYRFSGGTAVEHFTNDYGTWGGLDLSLYLRGSKSTTYFVNTSLWERNDGLGAIGSIGAWLDIAEPLYTYTALSMGSESVHNPLFRFDHEFNFKLGQARRFVATAGVTIVRYHDDHYDLMPFPGLTVYLDNWVLGYRLQINISNPGEVISLSHRGWVEFGREGHHVTTLTGLFGKAAYLDVDPAGRSEVSNQSFYAALRHTNWIGDSWGLYGEVNFLTLSDQYQKVGGILGAFIEWGQVTSAMRRQSWQR